MGGCLWVWEGVMGWWECCVCCPPLRHVALASPAPGDSNALSHPLPSFPSFVSPSLLFSAHSSPLVFSPPIPFHLHPSSLLLSPRLSSPLTFFYPTLPSLAVISFPRPLSPPSFPFPSPPILSPPDVLSVWLDLFFVHGLLYISFSFHFRYYLFPYLYHHY